jgi:UDP-N-acetylbacillosamine N-acetyltransferase
LSKSIYIYGASGHGMVVGDIAKDNKYDNVIYIDDGKNAYLSFEDIKLNNHIEIALGIGNNEIRKKIFNKLISYNFKVVNLIHSSAIILSNVKIGDGTIIMPNVVVSSYSSIGKGVILNTSSIIEHECLIEDFSHISINASLAGGVKIGNSTFVGMGASVINKVQIASGNTIGAGSVVIKDTKINQTLVGIPAKRIFK